MNTTTRIATALTAGALALSSGAAASACPERDAPAATPTILKVEGVPPTPRAPHAPSAPHAPHAAFHAAPVPGAWVSAPVVSAPIALAFSHGPGSGDGIAWTSDAPHASEHAHAQHETRHVVVTDDDGRTFELRIIDGQREVKVDGERVGEDRIREDGRRIIVLGDDGQELTRFFVTAPGGGSGQWTPEPGTPHGEGEYTWSVSMGEDAPPVMLGINQSEVSDELRYQLRLGDEAPAILVERVIPGLPAERAGLRNYDVIVSIEGSEGASSDLLRERLMEKRPGDSLELMVISRGEKKKCTVELAPYSAERLGAAAPASPRIIRREGQPDVQVFGEWAPSPSQDFDWGQYGREMRDRAREEVMRAMEERGVADADKVERDVERALKQMEESLRDQAHVLEERTRQAYERAMELRGDRLVVPNEMRERVRSSGVELNARLAEFEGRLAGLEDALDERLDAMMERLEELLERYEDRHEED